MRKMLNTLFITSEDAYLALENENVVVFRGEEKNYTGFIMIDSFGSGTAFKKEKQSCFQNKTA